METIPYTRFGVRQLLEALNHPPRKALGQHFLYARPTVDRLVALCALPPGFPVVEIGPGLGHLTRALLEEGHRVIADELDRVLSEQLATQRELFDRLEVHCADILNVSLERLYPSEARIAAIGNLPYNISSRVLFHLLANGNRLERIAVMLQEEVALRMIAPPGGKDYGRLSVMCQYWGQPQVKLRVSRRNFYPVPNVDSAFVVWNPERKRMAANEEVFAALVECSFSQRRKMLRSIPLRFCAGMQLTNAHLVDACTATGIDSSRRAETLSVDEFLDLSDALTRTA
jgi:16S rRNA (adenine1518-N6/adenine1519-N6)-dimethyltransferase